MSPCRAYNYPANLSCGLMAPHDGPHVAAAYVGSSLRRIRFKRADCLAADETYPR